MTRNPRPYSDKTHATGLPLRLISHPLDVGDARREHVETFVVAERAAAAATVSPDSGYLPPVHSKGLSPDLLYGTMVKPIRARNPLGLVA